MVVKVYGLSVIVHLEAMENIYIMNYCMKCFLIPCYWIPHRTWMDCSTTCFPI